MDWTAKTGLDPWIEPVAPGLVSSLIGRTNSLFGPDIERAEAALERAVAGQKVCVIGASGSIGAAFVKELIRRRPGALYLVDINENALAHLVRDVRAAPVELPATLETSVVAFGSSGFERWFRGLGGVDSVFNFAALKHVRSERDAYSAMRMIETNVFALADFLAAGLLPAGARFFSVSSDKAVGPTNLMGATKRWMEREISAASGIIGTSARFANVAFSVGSLPEAFLKWLARRQPFAAPNDVRRYFISHQEAAQLCLLAGCRGEHAEVFAPRLDESEAVSMVEAAERVLRAHGMMAHRVRDEEEAKRSSDLVQEAPTRWPCVFSPSDTSGEKELEELWYADEARDEVRYGAISVMSQAKVDLGTLSRARSMIEGVARKPRWEKSELIEAVCVAVPELRHKETGRSLDQKL